MQSLLKALLTAGVIAFAVPAFAQDNTPPAPPAGKPQAGGGQMPQGSNTPPTLDTNVNPQEMREKVQNMTPEERQAIMDKMQAQIKQQYDKASPEEQARTRNGVQQLLQKPPGNNVPGGGAPSQAASPNGGGSGQ